MSNIFKPIIAAIDIGTTKITVLIAKNLDASKLEIIGIGHSKSNGLEHGIVVNMEETIESIKTTLKKAEEMAQYKIDSVYIGISGSHIQSFNSIGITPIKNGAVTKYDIERVLDSAKALEIEPGQQILHILPQYFIIDNKEKVTNPLGLYGIRLEAVVHIITGAITSIKNLIKCCERAGVVVKDIVLEQLASAEGVLSADEKNLGVGILDIGGGTSDFALYKNNSIRYTKVFPIAGELFTKDLAIGLRATLKDAERIKQEYGSVLTNNNNLDIIELESVEQNNRKFTTLNELSNILNPRAEELLFMLNKELNAAWLKPLMRAGLVLTGGGALLKNIDNLAKNILKLPVRIGAPQEATLLADCNNPIYATSYGLLKYASNKKMNNFENNKGPLIKKILQQLKSFLSDFF